MIPFTVRPWAIISAIGGVVVIIGCIMAYNGGVQANQKRMAPVIAGYEVRIDRLLGQLRELEERLSVSNAEVDALKDQADEREKASKAALKAARTQADRYRLRASQIAAARPTGDQCVASRDLIVTTIREDRQ